MVIGRAKYVPLAEMVATEATDKYIATMEKEADLDVSEVKMTVNKIADGTVELGSGIVRGLAGVFG